MSLKKWVSCLNNCSIKFLQLLAIAMKAGKLSVGEGRATDSIRKGEAKLIILSEDASQNTKKKFSDMGAYRSIEVLCVSDRYELGRTVGREFAVVIAVCDKGLSEQLMLSLKN